MTLSDEQSQKILDAINKKSSGRQFLCPVSNDAEWQIQRQYGLLIATNDPDNLFHGGQTKTFPNAIVICRTCGYSLLFNLFSLGLAEELGIKPTKADASG